MNRTLLLGIVICCLTPVYFFQGGFSNVNTRLNHALSISLYGSPIMGDMHKNTVDKASNGAEYLPDKAPLVALLSLPIVFVYNWLNDLSELSDLSRFDKLLQVVTIFLGILTTWVLLLALYNLTKMLRSDLDDPTINLRVFCTFFGTSLFAYATTTMSHYATAALVTCLVYWVAKSLKTTTLSFWPLVLVSACLGLCEYPYIVVVFFACGLLAWFHRPWFLRAALICLAPILAIALYNTVSFGEPFKTGYDYLSHSPFATGMSQGVSGITYPKLIPAIELLLGVYRGLLPYSPLLVLALFSGSPTDRPKLLFSSDGVWTTKIYWLCLVSIVSIWLINAAYYFWQGGASFGPRHLVGIIPLVATFALVGHIAARIWFILGIVAFSMLLPCVAIYLYTPEQIYNPWLDFYLPFALQNLVSVNPMDWSTPVADLNVRWNQLAEFEFASSNLGERWGLRGFASVLPFYGIVCAFLSYLYVKAKACE